MSLILAWVLFPLVLAAIGLGWGVIVERAGALRLNGALLLPLGLAAALVVAGTLTASSATAPAAVTVVAVGGAVGLVFAWRWRRWPGGWPLLAAVGVLLAYGAPVLLSGQATFTGYVKLDDTASWFNLIDNVMSHGRSLTELPPSTYKLELEAENPAYPLGSFMLVGVGRALTGVDAAWVFQPYLACCGAALALCLYALMAPVVPSVRIRALLAFAGAQPALLYGYSLWGGIKEMRAAFPLAPTAPWPRWCSSGRSPPRSSTSTGGWRSDASGPMLGANQALSHIVFLRDRARFESESPELELRQSFTLGNYLRHLLSGG